MIIYSLLRCETTHPFFAVQNALGVTTLIMSLFTGQEEKRSFGYIHDVVVYIQLSREQKIGGY